MSNPTEHTYTVPQEHVDLITALLTENGPMHSSGILHHLIYECNDFETPILGAVLGMLYCPGTWRIDLSEDISLIGLDSQPKPGDGSVEAAAADMGLEWLAIDEDAGCWVPSQNLRRA